MSNETHTINTQTKEDMKNSILIVSVLINLFVFTSWLVVEVSPDYAFALLAR